MTTTAVVDRIALPSLLHQQLLSARGLKGVWLKELSHLQYGATRVVADCHVFGFDRGPLSSFDLDLRGGKGLGLSELLRLEMPVPPGATVLTTVSRYFAKNGKLPRSLAWEVASAIASLEKQTGLAFGSAEKPLLISVRSGAPVSLAGTMDTILNVGLSRRCLSALAARSGERFAWDCYRRYLAMFGTTVLKADRSLFEVRLKLVKESAGVEKDSELTPSQLHEVCSDFEAIIRHNCLREFPEDANEQLALAIVAVLESWQSERAVALREREEVSPLLGTAVNLQVMVFGNQGDSSGTGVLFSANPITGEDDLYGEFLANAQGEDVVGGVRTPEPVESLRQSMPAVYGQLVEHAATLSRHYRDMVEIEFTVEDGALYLLQVRKAKRSKEAAIIFAVNQVVKGEWIEEDAIMSVGLLEKSSDCTLLGCSTFNQAAKEQAMGAGFLKGTAASPGVVCGRLYFSIEKALQAAALGEKVILAREDTSPDDLPAMLKSKAIVTACGGSTSHAAVVARGLNIPAIVGCQFSISGSLLAACSADCQDNVSTGVSFFEGEVVSIDGNDGTIVRGAISIETSTAPLKVVTLAQWYKRTELNLAPAHPISPDLIGKVFDINQLHNDFYLLNSMLAAAIGHELGASIQAALERVEFQLCQIFTCYLTVAVYSELYHLPLRTRMTNLDAQLLKKFGRGSRACYVYPYLLNLADQGLEAQVEFFSLAAQAFLHQAWSGGYGGKLWSKIADAPRQYLSGSLPAAVFIDHVFDLRHNGGRLFDKSGMVRVDERALSRQLDAKKTSTSAGELFLKLTAICPALAPEVRALFDLGTRAGLWTD